MFPCGFPYPALTWNMQMEHVSLGVYGGRQAVRDAIKRFTENADVSRCNEAKVVELKVA